VKAVNSYIPEVFRRFRSLPLLTLVHVRGDELALKPSPDKAFTFPWRAPGDQ